MIHTQTLQDFRHDSRVPRASVRKALSNLGLRGIALRREVDRIVAGPIFQDDQEPTVAEADITVAMAAVEALIQSGDFRAVSYPYGWSKSEMTRPMRRIFHGKAVVNRRMLVVDEAWSLLRSV